MSNNKINMDWEIRDEQAREYYELEGQSASNPEQANKGAKSYYTEVGYAVTAALVTGALMFVGGNRWSSDPVVPEPTVETAPNPNIGSKEVLPDRSERIPEIPLVALRDIEDRYLGTGAFHSGETDKYGLSYSVFVNSAYLRAPLKEDFNGKLRSLLALANSNIDEATRDYLNNSTINVIYVLDEAGRCTENIFKYTPSPVSPRRGFLKTVSCPFEQIDSVNMSEKDLLIGTLKTYLSVAYDFSRDPDSVTKIWEAVIHAGQGQTWLEYRTHIGVQNSSIGIGDYEMLLALFPREEP